MPSTKESLSRLLCACYHAPKNTIAKTVISESSEGEYSKLAQKSEIQAKECDIASSESISIESISSSVENPAVIDVEQKNKTNEKIPENKDQQITMIEVGFFFYL